MIRVLGISGKRFTGKDTFAGFFDVPVFAFASESKRMFAARNQDIDFDRLMTDRAYKEAVRPRLTEFTVTEIARDPLVFCRSVADRITGPSLISDVRLKLEVEHLRSRFDFKLVRLVRSDALRASSGWTWTDGVDTHHTETELDDPSLWDEVVTNEGSIEELRGRAQALSPKQS